jgi:acetate kinase
MELLPNIPHVATFDTAFHQTIPDYAYIYGLPYEYYEKYKIRKYGFHGSSHSYVAKRAIKYCKMPMENTNLITCHLGLGSSVAAIESGKSCDTSMGFTPLGGLIMGTRCGDLDPAIINFLVQKGIKEDELIDILNKKSGLIGISKISNKIGVLEKEAEKGNKNAILALKAYAYKVKEYIGAYTAILVKVNILVFTGSIGEVSVKMREMICSQLENIGIILDKEKNKLVKSNIGIISADNSPITVMVVPTHEERKIAGDTYELIK